MEAKRKKPATVEEYIGSYPLEVQKRLNEIRAIIVRAAPEAEERISYGMPGYYLNGPLCYFAAAKKHTGLYPLPSAIKAFMQELETYSYSKGAIQFPVNKSLPGELIERIVKFRIEENSAKKKKKGK